MGGTRSSGTTRIISSFAPSGPSFGPELGGYLTRWKELSDRVDMGDATPDEIAEYRTFTVAEMTRLASNWLDSTLQRKSVPVYRSVSITGYSNERFTGGTFWSLRPEIASAYASRRGDGRIQTTNLPRGAKVWDESRSGRAPDVDQLRREGYHAVYRPDLMEVVIL